MPRSHDPRHDDLEAWAEGEHAARNTPLSRTHALVYILLSLAVLAVAAAALARLL
jgi:hypothetical protein